MERMFFKTVSPFFQEILAANPGAGAWIRTQKAKFTQMTRLEDMKVSK